jgi:hypothetical protein
MVAYGFRVLMMGLLCGFGGWESGWEGRRFRIAWSLGAGHINYRFYSDLYFAAVLENASQANRYVHLEHNTRR